VMKSGKSTLPAVRKTKENIRRTFEREMANVGESSQERETQFRIDNATEGKERTSAECEFRSSMHTYKTVKEKETS